MDEIEKGDGPIVIKRSAKTERPSVRPDDSRTAAAKRAQELRERRESRVVQDDEFAVAHLEPEGWKYQFNVWSVYNKREDSSYRAALDRGWQLVPRLRHPEEAASDSTDEWIFRKGMVLMEIPREIWDDMQKDEIKAARDQIRWKEQSLAGTPDGTMTRDHAQARPKISKSYEAIPIADK